MHILTNLNKDFTLKNYFEKRNPKISEYKYFDNIQRWKSWIKRELVSLSHFFKFNIDSIGINFRENPKFNTTIEPHKTHNAKISINLRNLLLVKFNFLTKFNLLSKIISKNVSPLQNGRGKK